MCVELKITIRDEEKRRLSKEFLIYEEVVLKPEHPVIDKCLKEIVEEFKGTPADIKIVATMVTA